MYSIQYSTNSLRQKLLCSLDHCFVSLFKQFQLIINNLLPSLRSFCFACSLLHSIRLRTVHYNFVVPIMSSKGKRLSESERLEVIAKLSVPSAPSKRSLGREYGVSEDNEKQRRYSKAFVFNVWVRKEKYFTSVYWSIFWVRRCSICLDR